MPNASSSPNCAAVIKLLSEATEEASAAARLHGIISLLLCLTIGYLATVNFRTGINLCGIAVDDSYEDIMDQVILMGQSICTLVGGIHSPDHRSFVERANYF
jgi:hypothetical protein